MTKEELIAKVREVAARLGGKTLMQKDFYRESGVMDYQRRRHFDRWQDLCAAAGIEPDRPSCLTDDMVLAALRDAMLDFGGLGSINQLLRCFRYNQSVIYSRWGATRPALRALRDWLLAHDPTFRYLDQLEQFLASGHLPGRSAWRNQRRRAAAKRAAEIALDPASEPVPEPAGAPVRETIAKAPSETTGEPSPVSNPAAAAPAETGPGPAPEPLSRTSAEPGHAATAPRPLVGEVIAYRGVMFAPTNEMGVVVLFAVAAEALGFVIEAVGTAFPDCSAWRRIACGRFEHLRLEFEFASSNFRAHRHDAKGCALLVCWEHDWPACPVPVLDLKKEIARLKRDAAENGR